MSIKRSPLARLGVLVTAAAFALTAFGCAHKPTPNRLLAQADHDSTTAATATAKATDAAAGRDTSVPDPFESINRVTFQFNDDFINHILEPVTDAYKTVTWRGFRVSIRNFFSNIKMPIRFINCLLQAKPAGAGEELGRFMVNSTLGIAGLVDAADQLTSLEKHDEDFGQTLAVWGLGDGFYLVWPILGPSTARDTVGMVGDYFADPITWVETPSGAIVLIGAGRFNELSFYVSEYESMMEMTFDRYTAAKDAYLQRRRAKIEK